jgi:predicted transcriptional regulator of viral defense system
MSIKQTVFLKIGTSLHVPRLWYNVSMESMHNSRTEQLLRLAVEQQIVRAKDATQLGIPRNYLGRLVQKGLLEKVGHGLYTSPKFSGTEHLTLVEASYQLPKGVVCLLSALRFHNFTTQSPHEVWVAIDQKAWAPKITSPPIRLVRMSGQALRFGIKEHRIAGAMLRVFSPAKTVADCFKFRNKIGVDVAIEGLKECRRTKKATMDEIWAAARICRVTNVIRPYMESL